MGLLTQTELDPLQAVRRAAEEHIEAIRAIGLARLKAMPRTYANDADFIGENTRYHQIADVVGALQTIYDAVSELEFEEETDPEPAEPEPVDETDDDEDADEDGDEDSDEEEA